MIAQYYTTREDNYLSIVTEKIFEFYKEILMTALKNVLILQETMNFFEGYKTDSKEEYESYMNKMKECIVFLPEDIERMKNNPKHRGNESSGKCKITCIDDDSFSAARRLIVRTSLFGEDGSMVTTLKGEDVVVLNFANPYHPGGGVRSGARAQEEDLCRSSNLLLSLESDNAKKYYQYNRENKNQDVYGNDYGSNTMVLSPSIKIIRNGYGRLNPGVCVDVGVITAAAPIVRNQQHLSDEYLDLFYERINSVLLCAAHYGYKHLVLGAWGCGAFCNDPEIVAKLFRDAIDNFSYDGKNVHKVFESITFAVLCDEDRLENLLEFKKQFRKEKREKTS